MLDSMSSNLGDAEIEKYLKSSPNLNNIKKWYFVNEFNVMILINMVLCVRLNELAIGNTMMHYKTKYGMCNFRIDSSDRAVQLNVSSQTRRILVRDTSKLVMNQNISQVKYNVCTSMILSISGTLSIKSANVRFNLTLERKLDACWSHILLL